MRNSAESPATRRAFCVCTSTLHLQRDRCDRQSSVDGRKYSMDHFEPTHFRSATRPVYEPVAVVPFCEMTRNT